MNAQGLLRFICDSTLVMLFMDEPIILSNYWKSTPAPFIMPTFYREPYTTKLDHQHLLTVAIGGLLVAYLTWRLVAGVCHPLNVFPGPSTSFMNPFYLSYLFATKRSHLITQNLHETYGPVVRLGPNLLSFADPKLLPQVYHRRVQKTPFYSTGLAGDTAPLLQIQSHQEHAAKLKVLAPTYSLKRLKMMEDQVDERVKYTLNRMHAHCRAKSPTIDLSEWIRWYVYDTITHLIYGEPAGFVAKERDFERLIENWHDMFFLGGLVATLPWLVHPIITRWPLKRLVMPNKRLNYGSGAIMQSHERFFQHRLRNQYLSRPGNIFDSFLNSKNVDGSPFSADDAERECFLLTVASQDTTAAFISPLISLLVAHSEELRRLREEITLFEKSQLLSSPVCSFEETTRMPFFMACVRETLRLRPPTPIILPRYVDGEGLIVDGNYVPPGTEIGANPWVINRSKDLFGPDVEAWRPDRWLEDGNKLKLMNKLDFVWGYGSRKCIGKNIALMDGQKFALQFFREFDVESARIKTPWRCENWGINIYFEQLVRLQKRES